MMNLAIIGYGKMGKEIERIAERRGHRVVLIIDADNRAELHTEAFRRADVAIEFTNPASAYANCMEAMNEGVKVVSGTTGWLDKHESEIIRRCEHEGKTFFGSSNFSLGVAIFSAVNRYLARIMNHYDLYDVRLAETHHVQKLDAPSGTAISLANDIVRLVERKTSWAKGTFTAPSGVKTPLSKASAEQVVIDSVREGEVSGIHTVHYESDTDTIEITHRAKNRSGFALGAVMAAEFAATHQGFLTMNDLFDF